MASKSNSAILWNKLSSLPKGAVLNVTSMEFNVLSVQYEYEVSSFKYLLMQFPVVSMTYAMAAKAADMIAIASGNDFIEVGEIVRRGQEVMVRLISDAPVQCVEVNLTSEESIGIWRKQAGMRRQSLPYHSPLEESKKMCCTHKVRLRPLPDWMTGSSAKTSRVNKGDSSPGHGLVARAKDMPNISAMFNL